MWFGHQPSAHTPAHGTATSLLHQVTQRVHTSRELVTQPWCALNAHTLRVACGSHRGNRSLVCVGHRLYSRLLASRPGGWTGRECVFRGGGGVKVPVGSQGLGAFSVACCGTSGAHIWEPASFLPPRRSSQLARTPTDPSFSMKAEIGG